MSIVIWGNIVLFCLFVYEYLYRLIFNLLLAHRTMTNRIIKIKHLSFFFVLLFLSQTVLAQMPNTISKAEKIYGLSKFWQEVNYNLNFRSPCIWESDS
ncbi:hypothetical protein FUAX_50620 (plasmid) [Fulvitalea axinellae]|uniref:Uncharacterized protein n=1 Tax=Fulvitalea axinellae TaxID=1182444 RepID=A0AAU9DJF8_9BACT|nr:hypothetical protein FUAX_50620 [Fulvitalea axinellae]